MLRICALKTWMLALPVCALLLGVSAGGNSAQAASDMKVGMLTCNIAPGWGYLVGSSRKVLCTFSKMSGGRTEYYTGKMSKVGLDVGFVQGGSMVWAVLTPVTGGTPAGALGGNYIGATAGAAVGVGGSVNALVGGQSNSFSLQPLSTTGNKGLNLAAGMETLTLTYQPLYPNLLHKKK